MCSNVIPVILCFKIVFFVSIEFAIRMSQETMISCVCCVKIIKRHRDTKKKNVVYAEASTHEAVTFRVEAGSHCDEKENSRPRGQQTMASIH